MARVFLDENHVLKSTVNPVEKTIYRLISCKGEEMDWKKYAYSLLVFNFMGFIFLLFLQLSQRYLPLNPQKISAPSWPLAFNTSISFVTNANWQSYSGETTLSYLVQMAILKEVFNQMILTVSLMRFYNQWEQLNLSFYQVL
jgi:potassium-transporting ATPase potassium-binding subunit